MKLTSASSFVGCAHTWLGGGGPPPHSLPALGAVRRVEDDDVADVGIAEARADAVDEHALADLQRRHHRLGRDPVRLDQERLDAQGEAERDRDDQDELEERASGPELFFSCFGLVATSGTDRSRAPRRGLRRPRLRRLGRGRGLGGRSARSASASASACASTASPGTSASCAAATSAAGSCSRPRSTISSGPGVAALADAGALADTAAQVVELGAPDVTAGGDLDPLDLRRVHAGTCAPRRRRRTACGP